MTGKHPSRRLTESRLIDRTSNNFRPLVAASLCALFAIGCGDDPGPTDPPDPPDPPGPPAGFQIEIRYVEGTEPTEEQRGYFDAAVDRWEQAIVGDLEEVYVNQPVPFTCQKLTAPAMDEEIDDLVVFVEFGQLDGPQQGINISEGSAVGWGGPCVLRDSYLPAVSSITIDIDDMNSLGDWTWLAIHELGHALGFGEVWFELGLLSDASDPAHGAPGPIEPVADATISSYFADQNFGLPDGSPLSENLVVGANLGMWTGGPDDELFSFLLQFQLPEVITVPPVEGYLTLHASESLDGSEPPVVARNNLTEWSEAAVTWNTKPDVEGLGSFQQWNQEDGTLTVKIRNTVREWVATGNDYGVTILPGLLPPAVSQGFHSRHAADPDLRPTLVVTPDSRFVGTAATAAFEEVGGDQYPGGKVPIDNSYPGETELGDSSDAHWRGFVLRNEIMATTGSSSSPLSKVTIASMEDMGYEVDLSAADRYTILPLSSAQPPLKEVAFGCGGGSGPRYRVGAAGQISMTRR